MINNYKIETHNKKSNNVSMIFLSIIGDYGISHLDKPVFHEKAGVTRADVNKG